MAHRIEITARMITDTDEGELVHQAISITEHCQTPQEFCWKAPRLIGGMVDGAQKELETMACQAMKGETPWEKS